MGSDIKVGQTVLQAGDMLGPAEIGILATVGAATLKVMSWQPHTSVILLLQTSSCCIASLALLSKAGFACCKLHKATFCCVMQGASYAVTGLLASFWSGSCKAKKQEADTACLQPSHPVCSSYTAKH